MAGNHVNLIKLSVSDINPAGARIWYRSDGTPENTVKVDAPPPSVSAELDGGPRIIQGRVPVEAEDDAASLAARVLAVEHRIYPEAARLFASGRLRLEDGRACLDGTALDEPVHYPSDD